MGGWFWSDGAGEQVLRDDSDDDTERRRALMSSRVQPAAEGIDPAVNLGSRLRQARLDSDMTLRELARTLGVSPSFVSQLENGKSQPSVATLYSLAQLLGVSIDQLFDSPAAAAPSTAPPPEAGEPADRQP